MGHLGYEGLGVEMGAESSGRRDDGYAVGREFLYEILDKLRSLAEVLHVEALVEALRHGFDGAHVHTAVGEKSLVERHVGHHALLELAVVRDDGATAGKTQFAS